jgi:hypothetical protein
MLALNAGASTSNLIILGNSFEEQSMDSIAGIKGSGPGFSNIAISGNTFALTKNNINFNDQAQGYLSVLSINGNIFRGIGPGSVAITLNGESVFSVNGNTIEGQNGDIGIAIGPRSTNGKICGNKLHGWATNILNQSGSTELTC